MMREIEIPSLCEIPIPIPTPSDPKFRVRRLTPGSEIPTKGSKNSAGYDLYAFIPPHCLDSDLYGSWNCIKTLKAHDKVRISTGCAFAIDPGYYGRLAARSSVAWEGSISVGAGVIDGDYRGEVSVILFNHGDADYVISHGDRIGQIIFEKIAEEELVEVTDFVEETERGAGGFGSTGK